MRLTRVLLFSWLLLALPAHAELHGVAQVAPGIWRGSEAEAPEDYETLRKMGIRTVVSLQMMPWDFVPDREATEAQGMAFFHAPMTGWIFEPSVESVNRAIEAIADPALQPVYLHCKLGHDRTGLVVGLYRVYKEGWDPKRAYDEMLADGFNETWILAGLRNYFWDHSTLGTRYFEPYPVNNPEDQAPVLMPTSN